MYVDDVVMFCDADWAGDNDSMKSTTGFLSMYAGGCLSWNSRLQPTVAKSSTEAEYIGLSSACDEAVWLRQLFCDLGHSFQQPTTIYEDNQGAIDLSYNPVHHKRTKHINVRYHSIREKVEEGTIAIKHIPTENQVADLLTKSISKGRFEALRSMILHTNN